jgi:dipeptidyl-peptidase-3
MMADPKLLELGAFADRQAQDDVVRDAYVSYVNMDLFSLRADPDLVLREAHRRGHHLVTEFLLNGGVARKDYGIKRVTVDGKTFFQVGDLRKARAGVADLLALLQKYKSTADDKGATDLVERFGTHVDGALRDESIRRAEPLNVPRLTAFAFPRLVPVLQDGQVVDARAVHDEDILTQARRIRRIWAEPLPEGQ